MLRETCLFCFKDTDNAMRFDVYNGSMVKVGQRLVYLCRGCCKRFQQGKITMQDVSARCFELDDMADILKRMR